LTITRPLTMDEAVALVIKHQPNPYAVAYAEAVGDNRAMVAPHKVHEADRVQALYILNNLSTWRGPIAALVKASLRVIGGLKLTAKDRAAIEGGVE
jgi:hypothetical protein